jgi:hypothetical protein
MRACRLPPVQVLGPLFVLGEVVYINDSPNLDPAAYAVHILPKLSSTYSRRELVERVSGVESSLAIASGELWLTRSFCQKVFTSHLGCSNIN